MRTITVQGSWGILSVHAETGIIAEYEAWEIVGPNGPECGYYDIARFDPIDIRREGSHTDILALGYWLKDGSYIEPLAFGLEWRKGDRDEWPAWEPLRYLPAPRQV